MGRGFSWTLRETICACAALGAAVTAVAEDRDPAASDKIRIEVTGSNVPHPDTESGLPVQMLTREDIARSGVTTTAELLNHVSANFLGSNDQLAMGDSIRPGLASANLRGIGAGSTLVLLDGRRVANYAFDGGAVDLNTIPLSAIKRVEILKDGASAIYGSDAIAGVVNFILRDDFRGLEATTEGAWTQHGGAGGRGATVSAGRGALATDGYNVFATMSYTKEGVLWARDRPYARTGYLPSEGVNLLSTATFPANIQAGPRLIVNPTYATGCAPPTSIPTTAPLFSTAPLCGFDYPSTIALLPPTERIGAFARVTFLANFDHRWFAEASYAHDRFLFTNSPSFAFRGITSDGEPVFYPAGGPYYPTAFAAANGLSGDLNLRYRLTSLGPRRNATDTNALRVLAGAEGVEWGWRYDTALSYARNRETDSLVSGYVSQRRLLSALATGLINPFGASGPDGDALLAGTQIVGDVHVGEGSTLAFDARTSREIYDLPVGPLAIALGAEARRERLDNTYASAFTSGDVLGNAGAQPSARGARTVDAAFVEASVPMPGGLEAQVAARYDHYSDFGGTTNPKVSLRWQPARALLLRGSWGTGFRAPTLYDLHTPLVQGVLDQSTADPVRCPVTQAVSDCVGFFRQSVSGGNPNLHPERSEQVGAGFVWQPASALTLGADYWKINKRDVIGTLDPTVIFAQFDRFALTNIIRGPVDPAFPGLPGPIETVVLTNQNLGDLRTSGFDVDVAWRGPPSAIGTLSFRLDGTYVLRWDQQLDARSYTSSLGRNGFDIVGPVPRWKHYATLTWKRGAWDATLAQTYQSGYSDANVDRNGSPLSVPPRDVGSYEIWDLQGHYSGLRGTTITLGVKNLMDRAPPFSNQSASFQVGFDPKYADPRGRMYYARLSYEIK